MWIVLYLAVALIGFIASTVFFTETSQGKKMDKGGDLIPAAVFVWAAWGAFLPMAIISGIIWGLTIGARWTFREVFHPKENV